MTLGIIEPDQGSGNMLPFFICPQTLCRSVAGYRPLLPLGPRPQGRGLRGDEGEGFPKGQHWTK